jgi:hypothetical protein
MPVISNANRDIIRQRFQWVGDLYVNIPALKLVATATISASPTEYPVADYGVTNTSAGWTNAIESMLCIVRRPSEGNREIFRGTLRNNALAGILRLQARQTGDTGDAQFQAENIQAGDVAYVYEQRIPKSQLSRIDPVTGEFYKRYDVPFNISGTYTRQTQYPKPQPNLGKHQHIVSDPATGLGRATLSRTGSFGWYFGLTGLWELPAGMTLRAGYTTAMETVEVDVVPGEYQYANRVEENTTAQIKRGYRWLFCTSPSFKAFSEKFAVRAITGDKQSRLGRSMRLVVTGNSNENIFEYLYSGAPVTVTYRHAFSANAWINRNFPSAGTLVENFHGYIRNYSSIGRTAEGIDIYEVFVENPLQYFAALPIAAQSMVVKDPPSNWAEIASAIAGVDGWIYELIELHAPMIFQTTDFYRGDLSAFKKHAYSSVAPDLFNAVKQAATLAGLSGVIGSVSSGAIYLKRHPSYESDSYRNSVPVQWSWLPEDLIAKPGEPPISYPYDPIMSVGELEGSGVVTGVTSNPDGLTARAGLFAQKQGIRKDTCDGFIGLSLNDIRDRVGHEEQIRNAPVQTIGFDAVWGADFIEPALMEFQNTSGLAALDPANTGVLNRRQIPQEVNRSWEFTPLGIRKNVNVLLQPETKGARAPEKPYKPVTVNSKPIKPVEGNSWCRIFDFRNGDTLGWNVVSGSSGTPPWANWTGDGWQRFPSAPASLGQIETIAICRVWQQETTITGITIELNVPLVNGNGVEGSLYAIPVATVSQVGSELAPRQPNGLGPVYNIVIESPIPTIGVTVGVNRDQNGNITSNAIDVGTKIIKVTLRGTGVNPFGTNNCI